MRRRVLRGAALLCALQAALVLAAPAWAAPPGGSVSVAWVRVGSAAPLVGDNLTIEVALVNNASFDFVLANLTVVIDASSASPTEVAHLENVTVSANGTEMYKFYWVAVAGVHIVTAQAYVRGLNGSAQPLPPASNRTSVSKPQIQEAAQAAAGIVVVLLAVLVIAVAPALIDHLKGSGRREGAARPRVPREDGPPASPPSPPPK